MARLGQSRLGFSVFSYSRNWSLTVYPFQSTVHVGAEVLAPASRAIVDLKCYIPT